MAKIELVNVSHSYDSPEIPDEEKIFAVKDMNICWEDGYANALLGPSGCGKTTMLNIISGLLAPSHGKILVDGKDVTFLQPRERGIAQVFQFPVVYDTMKVYDNLAFPLRNENMDEAQVDDKVRAIASILELTDKLNTPASRLYPAEKQKISLGRGIIRENTAAVLLDEPLTVIDPRRKLGLKRKLRKVQETLKKTMIYVTHDQHEALTFADDVTIIKDGRLIQKGTPEELHTEPATPFVGYFIGSPGMNILDFTLKNGDMDFSEFSLKLPENLHKIKSLGNDFQMGIRPEFIETRSENAEGWTAFTVTILESNGAYRIFTMNRDQIRIKARVEENITAGEGDTVWVRFPGEKMKIFKDEKKVV